MTRRKDDKASISDDRLDEYDQKVEDRVTKQSRTQTTKRGGDQEGRYGAIDSHKKGG